MLIGLFGGCMRRFFTIALLLAGAVLAWNHRDGLLSLWHELRGEADGPAVPSPALADAAQAKLAALSGGSPSRVALSEVEVQSLVQYRVAGFLPAYVVAPEVAFDEGRMRIQARIPTEKFPRIQELADVVGFLPDTTAVAVTGQLIPLDGSRVGLAIDEMSAARVPLPRGLIPAVLRRFGRTDEPGLPPDALALPLPPGASTAYIRGDSLIFVPRSGRDH